MSRLGTELGLLVWIVGVSACGGAAKEWEVQSQAFPGVVVRCISEAALSADDCRELGEDLADFHLADAGRLGEVIELRITGSGENRRCLMTLRGAGGAVLVSGNAPCGG